jgi:hypothetical protein
MTFRFFRQTNLYGCSADLAFARSAAIESAQYTVGRLLIVGLGRGVLCHFLILPKNELN